MITTLIICGTIILCLLLVLKWVKDMSAAELPMFTYGECVQKEYTESVPNNQTIGFVAPEESSEKKSDKEQKEAVFKDPITMTAALLRGEVDIDDVTI